MDHWLPQYPSNQRKTKPTPKEEVFLLLHIPLQAVVPGGGDGDQLLPVSTVILVQSGSY